MLGNIFHPQNNPKCVICGKDLTTIFEEWGPGYIRGKKLWRRNPVKYGHVCSPECGIQLLKKAKEERANETV
jgi:ribosomal protein L34E